MAKSKALAERPVTPEVLMPEQSLVATDGAKITAFLKNLAPFFATARQLETQARRRLDVARAFRMPTTAEEDMHLQLFIRECSAERKVALDHWEITSLLSKLHKCFVAARDRVTGEATQTKHPGLLIEAATIAQRLHNQYVEQERRRAQEEEQRRRQEEMRKAEEARQQELAALEAKALEAEQASGDLSEREQHFVELVANGYNTPETAARAVGYKDPAAQAKRLMDTSKIVAAIQAQKDAAAMRRQAQAIAAKPVQIEDTRVEVNVIKVGTDRTTWSANVFDGAALRAAAIDDEMLRRAGQRPKYGIPIDVLMVNPVVCNDYAKSMHEAIDAWPGVQHVKKTKTV